MNPQAMAFRRVAAQVCRNQGYSFRTFMTDDGLEDILEEANEGNWGARQIAITVLADCCVEEGSFNNFQVGFTAVVLFLREQLGPLGAGEEQAFRDLLAILNSGGTIEAITRWVETHYPNA